MPIRSGVLAPLLSILLPFTLSLPFEAPVAQPFQILQEASQSLEVTVPVDRNLRIAIDGARVTSAVWDQATVELQIEPQSGQVYALAHSLGPTTVFLTTQTHDTVSLRLNVSADKGTQNIVLKGPAPTPTTHDESADRPTVDFTASDYEGQLTAFVKGALRSQASPALTSVACKKPSAATQVLLQTMHRLHPQVKSCWSSLRFEGTVIEVHNTTPVRVALKADALTPPGVAALALTRSSLNFGQKTKLLIVELHHE